MSPQSTVGLATGAITGIPEPYFGKLWLANCYFANLDGDWVDDSKEYRESRKPEPIFAKILVVEFLRECLPKKLQKDENDALGSMALSFVSEPWVQCMPKPLWYEVGKQKIHMNSGVGRPVVNGQLAPAPIFIMSMATQWRGHLLA